MSDTDLPPLPDTPTGFYRHYKGGEYRVLGVVDVAALSLAGGVR